ncbi:sarcosine oxidase subunit gamma family protein [Rhizobium sp. BK251]|uniref:sarcosine oxidase subunit gamma n=1 Tax=Rhizobium sp. BK251 TaxID=2512125 RepID=UPI0010458236|nr:sarcosine oxidase subunit gamma family protein [Rhizobium sp. BK251]TCL74471.1 N-methylglutamate dehydrogenase subunit D [Rhizobium sp. BK251]
MTPTFQNTHPLEDHVSGFDNRTSPDHLAILRRPAIFSVLAHGGETDQADAALKALPDAVVRNASPGEWLVISETVGAETLAREISAIEWPLSIVDQSDGRAVLRISGPNVRRILAKCVAVDLHPLVFAEGRSANMLCCHVSANVARFGTDSFEIVVMRSYAGSVFEEIMEMGREFALTAGFSD